MNFSKIVATAFVAGLLGATGASAATVTQTQTLTVDGQDLDFVFNALPAGITGASVTIASGTSGGTEGIDLSGAFPLENEFFEVLFDGASQGSFSCGGPSSNGSTAIGGATDNSFNFNDCVFSLPLTVTNLAAFADNLFTVAVNFGSSVSHFDDADNLDVTLSYDVAAVPLPAGGLLLLSGLGGVMALKRRKQRRA